MSRRELMMDGFATMARAAAPRPVVALTPLHTLWAGIDPGKKGYVVAELPDKSLRAWPIPVDEEGDYDIRGIAEIARELKRIGVGKVVLEKQQPTRLRDSQGPAANNAVRASFMTGFGYALWVMSLTMMGIDIIDAWPSAWKKKMGISAPKGTPPKERDKIVKGLAVQEAHRRHPHHDFRRTSRCKPSPDQCEATLLIHYGKLKHGAR